MVVNLLLLNNRLSVSNAVFGLAGAIQGQKAGSVRLADHTYRIKVRLVQTG
jgi:hypothetical protein